MIISNQPQQNGLGGLSISSEDELITIESNKLANIVEDTSPQLGGNLDVVTHSLISTSNRNITITPNGTGNVLLGNFTFDADQTVGSSQDNFILRYDNSTGLISLEAETSDADAIAAVEGEATLDLTGQLTATNSSVPATFTRVANNQSPTMILEKDVGSGGDMSRRSSMLYAVKDNTTTKYLGLTAWDDDSTLGKTMRVRSLSDDATSGTDIAYFSGTSVDFQGDITVGGSGASLLQSSGNFEIDCGSDTLTITAGAITATLDGGTY